MGFTHFRLGHPGLGKTETAPEGLGHPWGRPFPGTTPLVKPRVIPPRLLPTGLLTPGALTTRHFVSMLVPWGLALCACCSRGFAPPGFISYTFPCPLPPGLSKTILLPLLGLDAIGLPLLRVRFFGSDHSQDCHPEASSTRVLAHFQGLQNMRKSPGFTPKASSGSGLPPRHFLSMHSH